MNNEFIVSAVNAILQEYFDTPENEITDLREIVEQQFLDFIENANFSLLAVMCDNKNIADVLAFGLSIAIRAKNYGRTGKTV